jgi:hypothetical protein
MGTSFFVPPPQAVAASGRNYSAENAARYDSLKAESVARKALRKQQRLQEEVEQKRLLEQSPSGCHGQLISVETPATFAGEAKPISESKHAEARIKQAMDRIAQGPPEGPDQPFDSIVDLRSVAHPLAGGKQWEFYRRNYELAGYYFDSGNGGVRIGRVGCGECRTQ